MRNKKKKHSTFLSTNDPNRPKIGDDVEIVESQFGHINVGEKGKVTDEYEGGYGVQFPSKFYASALPHALGKTESRTFWFAPYEIKKVATLQS